MLFSKLRLPVTNWRLILVQMLPAKWIWAVTVDLKAHALGGRQFHDIRGPVVLVLLAAVVLITIAAFYLNAAFAFAISQPGPRTCGPASARRASTSGRSPAEAQASAGWTHAHLRPPDRCLSISARAGMGEARWDQRL